jgi:hypothetical protein
MYNVAQKLDPKQYIKFTSIGHNSPNNSFMLHFNGTGISVSYPGRYFVKWNFTCKTSTPIDFLTFGLVVRQDDASEVVYAESVQPTKVIDSNAEVNGFSIIEVANTGDVIGLQNLTDTSIIIPSAPKSSLVEEVATVSMVFNLLDPICNPDANCPTY